MMRGKTIPIHHKTKAFTENFGQVYPFDNNNGEDFLQSVYNIKFAIKDLDNDGLVEIITAGQNWKKNGSNYSNDDGFPGGCRRSTWN